MNVIKYIIISLSLLSFLNFFGQSDNCATAAVVNLTNGTSCVNGTTINATSSNTLYGNCNLAATNEVWYTYVSQGANNTWQINSLGLTNAEIVIYTGGCGGTLELCNTATGTNSLNSNWGIPAGTQVWVGVMSNGGTEGDFELCVTSTPPAPTGGNLCSTAIPICEINNTTNVDISTLSSSGVYPSCFFSAANQDVWFEFTVISCKMDSPYCNFAACKLL